MFYVVVSNKGGGRFADRAKTLREAEMLLVLHKNRGAREVEVYREPLYSTTDQKALVWFYGKDSYWDNVSKENNELEKKRFPEQ